MNTTAEKALKHVQDFEIQNKRTPADHVNNKGIDILSVCSQSSEERHIEVKGIVNNTFTLFSNFNYKQFLKSGNKFYLYVVKIYPNGEEKLYILNYEEVEKLIPEKNRTIFNLAIENKVKRISINYSIHLKDLTGFLVKKQ